MTETTTCPWTGHPFAPQIRGGNEKVFANSAARAEAHKAARLYAENLIAQGFLSWAEVRRWYEGRSEGAVPPCTAQEGASEHCPREQA